MKHERIVHMMSSSNIPRKQIVATSYVDRRYSEQVQLVLVKMQFVKQV